METKKRVFDEKTRRYLAGLLPFSPGATAPYTPDEFEKVPEDLRPVFYVRAYTDEQAQSLTAVAGDFSKFRKAVVKALSEGALAGWDNLIDLATGEEVPYSPEAVSLLPAAVMLNIHTRCSEFAGLTEPEREGFGS